MLLNACGQIKGQPGDTFNDGKLDSHSIDNAGNVLPGAHTIFDKTDFDQINF
jgi:hypothetical protein